MPKFCAFFVVIVGLCGGHLPSVTAQSLPRPAPIVLDHPDDAIRVPAGVVRVLRDPGGRLDVESVVSLDHAAWRAAPDQLLFGYSKDVIWLSFDLVRLTDNPVVWLTEHHGVDEFQVWLYRPDRREPELAGQSGWSVPSISESAQRPRAFSAVPLTTDHAGRTTVLVRVTSESSMNPQLVVLGGLRFLRLSRWASLLQGAGMGFGVLLALYALMAAVSVRRREFVTYLILVMVSVVVMTYVTGLGSFVLWSAVPQITSVIGRYLSIVFALVSLEFFRLFLDLPGSRGWLARFVTALEGLLILQVLVSSVVPVQRAFQANAVVSFLAFVAMAVVLVAAVVNRRENAWPLLLAWSGLIIAGAGQALVNFGIVEPRGFVLRPSFVVTVGLLLQNGILAGTLVRRAEQGRRQEHLRRRAAERQMDVARRRLVDTERMGNLATLVSSVYHELGTPLGIGVTLGSDLRSRTRAINTAFLDGTMTRAALTDYLASTAEAGEALTDTMQRARELVDGFKHVAADQALLDVRTIDLSDYLERLIRSLRPRFKSTQHRLELHAAAGLSLETTPGLVAQVVTNLVINSLVHGLTPETPGTVTVRASRDHDPEFIVLSVEDSGKGISQENQGKVFEPYFTTAAEAGGTGLGLAIVKTVVEEQLHGKISLHSEAGIGTTVTVTIPATG